jgi:hypothetical protein
MAASGAGGKKKEEEEDIEEILNRDDDRKTLWDMLREEDIKVSDALGTSGRWTL